MLGRGSSGRAVWMFSRLSMMFSRNRLAIWTTLGRPGTLLSRLATVGILGSYLATITTSNAKDPGARARVADLCPESKFRYFIVPLARLQPKQQINRCSVA